MTDYKALVDACQPYLKEDETPAECIARNREDVNIVLRQLVRTLKRTEAAEAELERLQETDPRMNKELIKSLKAAYHNACDDVSETVDTEPRIQCRYCDSVDVGPSHRDDCIARLCLIAAIELEDRT